MVNVTLTDTDGDPVLINWDNVTFAEETGHTDTVTNKRKFTRTDIRFVGNTYYTKVRDTVPQIKQKLREAKDD